MDSASDSVTGRMSMLDIIPLYPGKYGLYNLFLAIMLVDRKVNMAQENLTGTAVKSGIGFGSALAMVISFTINRSIVWAIVHGALGWLYVIYRALIGGYS